MKIKILLWSIYMGAILNWLKAMSFMMKMTVFENSSYRGTENFENFIMS